MQVNKHLGSFSARIVIQSEAYAGQMGQPECKPWTFLALEVGLGVSSDNEGPCGARLPGLDLDLRPIRHSMVGTERCISVTAVVRLHYTRHFGSIICKLTPRSSEMSKEICSPSQSGIQVRCLSSLAYRYTAFWQYDLLYLISEGRL